MAPLNRDRGELENPVRDGIDSFPFCKGGGFKVFRESFPLKQPVSAWTVA